MRQGLTRMMVGYHWAPTLHSSTVEAMTNMDYSPYQAPGVAKVLLDLW